MKINIQTLKVKKKDIWYSPIIDKDAIQCKTESQKSQSNACMCVCFGVCLTALQAHQAVITPERLQALGQEHIIVAQEQTLSDQVPAATLY